MMRIKDWRRIGRTLAGLVLLATPVAGTRWAPPADAASSLQDLIARAEHDTNTVRTLVHQDTTSVTTPTYNLAVSARGSEDEVHNREHDFESVSVHSRGGSKAQSLHYTVDIIFMNGTTYYRTSFTNKWQSRKGMTFPDPYTGGWKRGRTTVSFPKSYKFTEVGTSGNQTHVRTTSSTSTVAGTVDLWISGGATPYVMREEESFRSLKGAAASEHLTILYGPFNTTMVIESPTAQGST